MYVSSGYQISSSSSAKLPFVLIRERGGEDGSGSGVHFIGLDGYNFLAKTNGDTMFEGITMRSAPASYDREKDIVKLRSFQDLNQSNNPVGAGFNVTSGLSDFFASNYDKIVLKIANETINETNSYLKNNKIFNFSSNTDVLP
jgi:hypothetical protein